MMNRVVSKQLPFWHPPLAAGKSREKECALGAAPNAHSFSRNLDCEGVSLFNQFFKEQV